MLPRAGSTLTRALPDRQRHGRQRRRRLAVARGHRRPAASTAIAQPAARPRRHRPGADRPGPAERAGRLPRAGAGGHPRGLRRGGRAASARCSRRRATERWTGQLVHDVPHHRPDRRAARSMPTSRRICGAISSGSGWPATTWRSRRPGSSRSRSCCRVCVLPDYYRSDVQQEVLTVLGTGRTPDGPAAAVPPRQPHLRQPGLPQRAARRRPGGRRGSATSRPLVFQRLGEPRLGRARRGRAPLRAAGDRPPRQRPATSPTGARCAWTMEGGR